MCRGSPSQRPAFITISVCRTPTLRIWCIASSAPRIAPISSRTRTGCAVISPELLRPNTSRCSPPEELETTFISSSPCRLQCRWHRRCAISRATHPACSEKWASAFSWQEGYGAFSVSHSRLQVVADYIANQAEHHRKWSFEQEFVALLLKAGVEYDPQFVFG